MSDSYVTAKILEALKTTNNDIRDAQKLILTWAVRDQPLLLGLAKPHLKALALARIDEVRREAGEEPSEEMEKEMNAIILNHTEGEKRHATMVPPPKASKRQATIMKMLVNAFKKK